MEELVKQITALVQDRAVRDYVTDLLVSICKHDTTPYADVKVMRQLLKLRKMKPHDRMEQEELLDVYKSAIGML